ncbi:hypothetical protein GR247_38590 [Rhizobium leguminosarum]|nr:hypothetical protein [Rhizobium leguminosarum]NKK61760.1 hypothetical protein [Rhizobium leguminosarum bv. viciae]
MRSAPSSGKIETLLPAVELGYDARRPVDHPTPFEPTECCNLTRKGSKRTNSSIQALKTLGCALCRDRALPLVRSCLIRLRERSFGTMIPLPLATAG